MWTAMIALVLSVTLRSRSLGSIVSDSSISIADRDGARVDGAVGGDVSDPGTRTSSPSPIPRAWSETSRAEVPEFVATACEAPRRLCELTFEVVYLVLEPGIVQDPKADLRVSILEYIKHLRAFFVTEAGGSWSDHLTAFLLLNPIRRDWAATTDYGGTMSRTSV